MAEIGKYLQVTTIEADDGSQSLFIGGGQRLVLGAEASSLSAMADPFDPSQAAASASATPASTGWCPTA